MNKRFRVALRVGTSYMESLYCSWPLGVLEFSPEGLIFNGPFIGRFVVPKEAIIEMRLHRSLLSELDVDMVERFLLLMFFHFV